MRTTRKDGNCFYRAFGFRFCELIRENKTSPWAKDLYKRAKDSKDYLVSVGYDLLAIEDFHEMMMESLDAPQSQDLIINFQTDHISDAIVCYLRLMTAAALKKDRDMYEAFILDTHPTLDIFIANTVEPSK